MKIEHFFEKFDEFAEAPNEVAKIREMVMWSAFCGDFSSEERDQPMPEEWVIDSAPILPAIPFSWKWQRGNELFQVIRGVTYTKIDAINSPAEGFLPLLRANNIGNGINYDDLVYVPRENIRDEQFIRRGDILIAMSSGSKKLVGKAAQIVTEFNCAFGAFCGVIRNKSEIHDNLLARYFQSPQYTSWVTAAGRGIGINNLGRGDLDSLPVPVPPLAEQKRIVSKVDELMALCDRLEAQQKERETRLDLLVRASLARFADAPTPANLNFLFHKSFAIPPADLRKSILSLAVQGKLVRQDHRDEPAFKLFERIQMEHTQQQAEGLYKSSNPLPPIAEADKPFPLPLGWEWFRLRSLVFTLGDGLHGTPIYSEGTECYFINGNNLVDGRIVIKPHTKTVSVNETQKHRKPMTLNTVLVSINGTLGSVAFYNNENVVLGKSACYFNLPSLVDKHFVRLVIESPYFVNYAIENATGTTIRNLGLKAMNYFPVPLPPLAEQLRIVAEVNKLMTLVAKLETQLTTSRDTSMRLMEALVAELTAFRS